MFKNEGTNSVIYYLLTNLKQFILMKNAIKIHKNIYKNLNKSLTL